MDDPIAKLTNYSLIIHWAFKNYGKKIIKEFKQTLVRWSVFSRIQVEYGDYHPNMEEILNQISSSIHLF